MRARRGSGVAMAAVVVLLAGCAGQDPAPAPAPRVLLEIVQLRGDVADGHVELRVTNEGAEPLQVARAEYRSSRWSAPMVRDEPATIPAGARRNLRLLLPGPTCDPAPIDHLAVLELADGTRVERAPEDPLGQLEGLDDAACDARAFAARAATVRWLEPAIPAAGAGPAVLRLEVAPVAGEGVLGRLLDAGATTLLAPVGADGGREEVRPIQLDVVGGAAPVVVELPFDPGRCDLHAIAEDKQGTLLRIRAELAGEPLDLVLPSPDAQRDALLGWAVERCAALGDGP